MAAVWMCGRAELRARWRGWLGVALLVGLTGGIVLTALAGARRTDSAFERFNADALTADISLQVDGRYFDEISELDEVAVAAPMAIVFAGPADEDIEGLFGLAAVDRRLGTAVDRPRIIEGRMFDPRAADEVIVNEVGARIHDLQPGSRLPLRSLSPDQLATILSGDPIRSADGPELEVRVVGIARVAQDLGNDTEPTTFYTPAFYAQQREAVGVLDNLIQVRLRDGLTSLPEFRRSLRRLVPPQEEVFLETTTELVGTIDDATTVQVTAFVLFAIVAGLAGLVVVFQAIGRQFMTTAIDPPTLRAIGVGYRARTASLLVPALVSGASGTVVAVGVAIAASPLMPLGLARRIEPDLGLSVDPLVLAAGGAGLLLLVAVGAALMALDVTRRARSAAARTRRSAVVGALTRRRLPAPVATGVRMALEPGRGRTSVPVRSALVGAAVGVMGFVAATTFGAAFTDVASPPSRYGWKWDAAIGETGGKADTSELAANLAGRRNTAAVATLSVRGMVVEGEDVQGYGLDAVEGSDLVEVLAGRAPATAGEALLGSGTLARLDARLGDTVTAETRSGTRKVRVVGRGVFPDLGDDGSYEDFALVTSTGLERVARSDGFYGVLVRWTPETDETAAFRDLRREDAFVEGPTTPTQLANLERVDGFPPALALFFAVLGAGAIAHALVVSIRRRARDFAVLKTLGFVRAQVSAAVAVQSSTFATVALLIGVPLGFVAGRWVWIVLADDLGISSAFAVPLTALALVVPAVLLVANLIAFVPGQIAARTRPAVVLRAE